MNGYPSFSTSPKERPRLLCVDDEPWVIEGISRQLYTEFDIVGAESGVEALGLLAADPAFDVILCDMRMPGLDGAAVMAEARSVRPCTARVLLTGQADLADAMNAVNQGNIFRFLFKPCPPDMLKKALCDAVEQHRTMTAERELLDKTLKGALAALLDTLSLANPTAFARATRIKQTVQQLAKAVQPPDRWCIEVAAMVSQIGCVVLAPDTLHKLNSGLHLSPTEELQVRAVPQHTDRLLEHIPRLEAVREILKRQSVAFHKLAGRPPGNGTAADPEATIAIGAQMLRLATDLEALEASGLDRGSALDVLQGRVGTYNPELVKALLSTQEHEEGAPGILALQATELGVGMTIARDVRDMSGRLLVGKGYEVTFSLIERFRNWGTSAGIKEPIFVLSPGSAGYEAGTTSQP